MSAVASGIDPLPVTQSHRPVLRLPPETDRRGSNAPLQSLMRSAHTEPPFCTVHVRDRLLAVATQVRSFCACADAKANRVRAW